jgi:hypothetical protein
MLEQMKQELEDFIHSEGDPVLLDGNSILRFAEHEWQITIQFGKMVLEVWNAGHSFAWRVDEVTSRDRNLLELSAHRPGAHQASTLELRRSVQRQPQSSHAARSSFRRELLASLKVQFPDWQFQRVGNRSDRGHSFSAWYTRGFATRGRAGWAFLGLSDSEPSAAADGALAYGLIWLDWLRETEKSFVISGVKLFLPPAAVALTAHRAAYLNPKAAQIEVCEWPSPPGAWSPVDLRDFGNVETWLAPRRQSQMWLERHQDFLHRVFGAAFDRLELTPDSMGNALSVRALGLEIARLQGDAVPRLVWGIEGDRCLYRQGEERQVQEFVMQVLDVRGPRSKYSGHPLYRLQPERWLESLVVRDLTRLDPALHRDCVYPQVPAFSGGDRGVVDVLSVLRDGRLAVIELKLQEEITLPIQGLDYWLRVKWLNDRNQFQEFGYFQGLDLASAPPVIYLVSPAFRFHSTTQRIVRYLSPSVEVIQVGINQKWRDGVKVLLRRHVHPYT